MITEIITGTTVKIEKSYPEYKASDGWTMFISLRGPGKYDFWAIGDGDNFVLELASGTTSSILPGEYWFEIYVERSGVRYAVETGNIKVLQALIYQNDNYDGRSEVKRILDAIESTLEGRATSDQLMYTIAGRSISKIPIPDLIQLRGVYKAEYLNELQTEQIKKGLGSGRKILARFL